MTWEVYNKTGETVRCEVHKLEYNGTWMGECFVSVTINSPIPIDFAIGDYLEYRNERFEINYDPSALKKAAIRASGESFVYDNVKFNSLSDELTRCDFLDYVKNDNNIHFTTLPKFSFYASSIQDLADRIQVNLDRIYKDDKKWSIEVHPEYVSKTDVNISADNIKVWDALALVNSQFKANFIIRGRVVTIGTAGIPVDNVFRYGKGKGLYEIERTAESDQQTITRLRAYGSKRNLPNRYYNKLSGGGGNHLPDNMAVNFLMLPGFPETTLDPYIDSENIKELGVREGTIFFDGSDEEHPEIYPSMEDMTADDLKEAGIPVQAEGNLDEVVSAEQIDDDGVPDEEDNAKKGSFTITLKDIGFDINDYLTSNTATISMKSGACGGREFEIAKCEKSGNNYILTCNRVQDSSLNLYFPYNGYNIRQGDKFALLNIDMPDVYIKAASQRLLDKANEYLSKNDYTRYSYEPKVDDIYMARQHDEAIATGGTSIHDTIKEGDIFLFNDADLGIDGSITIDSLTIKEGESVIPQYEIVLREEKTVGTIQKMQNQIDSISGGQGAGGYTAQQIQGLIKAYGSLWFLSKIKSDETDYLLKLLGGVITTFVESPDYVPGAMGAGLTLKQNADGQSYAEVDKLLVRMKAVFQTLSIMETELGGSSFLFNPSGARATLTRVERKRPEAYFIDGARACFSNGDEVFFPDVYRCYFMVDDGDTAIENLFKVGDMVRSQTFNIEAGVHEGVSNHYWWRLVAGKGRDYIDVSSVGTDEDSNEPSEGDVIVQLGNTDDTDRQAAIVMSAYGDGAPSLTFYTGINSFSLSGKDVFTIAYDRVEQECYIKSYGRMYIGDREEKNYLKFTKKYGLEVRANRFLFSNGEDIETRIEATERNITLKLKDTGIDIESGQVTVTADRFLVQDSNGTGIAVFKMVDGKPLLRTENIDVDNLKVKHLDGATGTFSGELMAATGTFGGEISADGAKIGGFTMDNGSMHWKGNDYFGGDSRSIRLGVPSDNNSGMLDISFNGATQGRFGVKVVGSNLGGACIYASRNGTNRPVLANTYAGYFDGGVHVEGNVYTNVILSNEFGTDWTLENDGTYTYQKGVTDEIRIPSPNGTLVYRLRFKNGILIDIRK